MLKKKKEKKIGNIDREILQIFWTTWGISMRFSGKMWLMIILKVTKKGFIFSFEETYFEKPQGGESKWPRSSSFGVNVINLSPINCEFELASTMTVEVNRLRPTEWLKQFFENKPGI